MLVFQSQTVKKSTLIVRKTAGASVTRLAISSTHPRGLLITLVKLNGFSEVVGVVVDVVQRLNLNPLLVFVLVEEPDPLRL